MKLDLLLCFVGIVGGMINAIAGGGGILMFPALLAAGLPAVIANATSSLVIWPGALTSAYMYRKQLKKVPRYYALLLIPVAIGAVIGSLTLIHTSGPLFEKLAPWLVVFAVTLLALQPAIHSWIEARSGKSLYRHPKVVTGVIALLIFPLAIYGGYFGVGYGIMVLAFLGFTNLKTIHQMNGIKNLTGATISIISTIYFASAHLIDWRTGLFMALGTAVGGFIGARIALKTSAKLVHNVTVIIGLVVALILLLKAYH